MTTSSSRIQSRRLVRCHNRRYVSQLQALINKWSSVARNKFRFAEAEDTEFGRRFIQHGAICYFNCAQDLQRVIKAGNPALDFKAQVFQQDAKRP